MDFPPQKCRLLRITNKKHITNAKYNIHGDKLEYVSSAKYLGVSIDKTLNWSHHIANITKKANGVKAFLQRNIAKCPTKSEETCFEHLVRPLVEYVSNIWDP